MYTRRPVAATTSVAPLATPPPHLPPPGHQPPRPPLSRRTTREVDRAPSFPPSQPDRLGEARLDAGGLAAVGPRPAARPHLLHLALAPHRRLGKLDPAARGGCRWRGDGSADVEARCAYAGDAAQGPSAARRATHTQTLTSARARPPHRGCEGPATAQRLSPKHPLTPYTPTATQPAHPPVLLARVRRQPPVLLNVCEEGGRWQATDRQHQHQGACTRAARPAR